jgi:hypothetical protein
MEGHCAKDMDRNGLGWTKEQILQHTSKGTMYLIPEVFTTLEFLVAVYSNVTLSSGATAFRISSPNVLPTEKPTFFASSKPSLSSRKGRCLIKLFVVSWYTTECYNTNLMFCWPCIIEYQYNETNVMHFSFSLLRIKSLYMFWSITWLSSGGVTQTAFGILRAHNVTWLWHDCSETNIVPQPTDIRTQYITCRLYSPSWGWGSNARNM